MALCQINVLCKWLRRSDSVLNVSRASVMIFIGDTVEDELLVLVLDATSVNEGLVKAEKIMS